MRKQEEEKVYFCCNDGTGIDSCVTIFCHQKNEVIKIHTELAKAQNGFAVAQVQMTAVHQDLLLKKR